LRDGLGRAEGNQKEENSPERKRHRRVVIISQKARAPAPTAVERL
jgi:hypothetical protein